MDTSTYKDTTPDSEGKGPASDSIYGDFPRELLERRQIVNYKMSVRHRANKPDVLIKMPYNPRTGQKASVDDPDTWGTAEEAADGVTRYRMQGGGFMFTEGEQERGSDLDHCYDPTTGQVTEQAMRIVRLLNSYTEITPSGVGLHVIVRAREYTIPEGQKVKVYDGQKVEMYGSGRFFTITGRHLPGTPFTVEERSAELRQAHEIIWGADAEGGPQMGPDGNFAPPTCGVTGLSDADVLGRCRSDKEHELFVAAYDDGDLGEFAYDASLADFFIWRKLVFYIGNEPARIMRLAEQGAHYLCPTAPDEAGVREKKWHRHYPPYGTFQERQIAYLLAGRGPERVFSSAAKTEHTQHASEKVKAWPAPLADVAYYGVLGDIARGIEPYIEADSAALLVNFVVASGIAIGRDPYFQVGAARHRTVLNAVTVGETGDNKGDGTTPLRAVLASVEPLPPQNGVVDFSPPVPPRIAGGLSTGEGLLWQIRDKRVEKRTNTKTHTVDEVVVDHGVSDKRLLVVESEFARVLAVMYRDGNTLSTVIREVFDSPPKAESNPKNNPVVATEPHVGIIGQITPAELHRKLQDIELYNGFANRYMWLLTHPVKSLPMPPDYTDKAREHARRWSDAVRTARNTQVLYFDHRAEALWRAEYDLLKFGGRPDVPPREGMALDVCSRARVLVPRMALIFAALDGAKVITTAHLEAALAIWDYCERCASYLFSDVTSDPVENVIANALRSKGRMSRDELRGLFSRHQPSAAIQAALDALAAAGKVRCVKEQTRGRAFEYWEWVTP